jgi:predicted nucleotidyltransferase
MKGLETISQEILPALLSNGAKRVALFGSVVRGQATSESDIDILVAFKEPIGLFRLAHLQRELSQQLNRPVDLMTEDSLSRYIRPQVEEEKVVLYEKP